MITTRSILGTVIFLAACVSCAQGAERHTLDLRGLLGKPKSESPAINISQDGDIHLIDVSLGGQKLAKHLRDKLLVSGQQHYGIWIKDVGGDLPDGVDIRYIFISDHNRIYPRPTLPESPDAGTAEAIALKGNTAFAIGSFEEAGKYFLSLYGDFPDSRLAPYGMLMSARCMDTTRNTEGARDLLKALLAKYPQSRLVPVAKYRIACLTAGKFSNPDGAIDLFKEIIQHHPDSHLKQDCLFNIAALHMIQHQPALAAQEFQLVTDIAPESVRGKAARRNLEQLTAAAVQ